MLWRVPISTQSHLSRGYFMVHLWCFLCFLGYDRQGPELKTADQRLQWSLSLCGSRDSRPIKPNKSWKSSVSSLWEEPCTGETHIREKASERNHRRDSHQRESLWEEPPETLTSERKPLRGTTGDTHIREKALRDWTREQRKGQSCTNKALHFPFPAPYLPSIPRSLFLCYWCSCGPLTRSPVWAEKQFLCSSSGGLWKRENSQPGLSCYCT